MDLAVGFDFSVWHPHLDVWLAMLALGAGYVAALRYWGPAHATPERPAATRAQKLLFAAGLGVMWLGADWPIHDISEDFLFSIHMTQHTLFSLVAPPLMLLGTPSWVFRRLFRPKPVAAIVRFFTKPFIALILFNGVILVTHWPELVDLSLRYEAVHFVVHLVLVLTSFAMWWPVIGPLPEMGSMSAPAKMLYLFLQSILPTVPASFLTFASTPIYEFYAEVPRLWGLDVVTDQRIAGLIMKLGGGLLLWLAIAILFFRWSAREEGPEPIEEISWDDFEHELEAWNMRK